MMRVVSFAIFVCLASLQIHAVCTNPDDENPTDPNTPYSPNGRYVEASVYMNQGRATLKIGHADKSASVAYGFYNDSILTTGWSQLQIKAGYAAQASDRDMYYAAGFMEGALTSKQIFQNFENTWSKMKRSYGRMRNPRAMFKKFFDTQNNWAKEQIRQHNGRDSFWRHVDYVLAQFEGLYEGYKSTAGPDFDTDIFVVQFLNGVGDTFDISSSLTLADYPDYMNMHPDDLKDFVNNNGHCSVLIKMLPGYENIYMSHSSWFTFAATMRIYKTYDFNTRDRATHSKRTSFSSYAGYIESLDDFYLLNGDMVMLQTTINVMNSTMVAQIKPESLLAWQRVRVANSMATGGRHWSKLLARENSGTYNNQYMIVDLRKIHRRSRIDNNALWVVEQAPGLVIAKDQTNMLRQGYWASYNIPAYRKLYEWSGNAALARKYGSDYSYELAPRAKIFRRDQSKVVDMQSMKDLMRYNDYRKDEYSKGDAYASICSRGDFSQRPGPSGCYDTKVADYQMATEEEADIISGPTRSHGLPPFRWSSYRSVSHVGLPEVYNFDWVRTRVSL